MKSDVLEVWNDSNGVKSDVLVVFLNEAVVVRVVLVAAHYEDKNVVVQVLGGGPLVCMQYS